jgi:hypothetical protein
MMVVAELIKHTQNGLDNSISCQKTRKLMNEVDIDHIAYTRTHKSKVGLIMHTNKNSQYSSHQYRHIILAHLMMGSMSWKSIAEIICLVAGVSLEI